LIVWTLMCHGQKGQNSADWLKFRLNLDFLCFDELLFEI